MPSLLLSCRRCGAPVDPGARAALARPGVVLDLACGACGHRALHPFPSSPARGVK